MSDVEDYLKAMKLAEKAKAKAEEEKRKNMKPMTPQEIAAAIKEKFVMAATEVANDAHAESVIEEIVSDLNKQKREVTLRLLGLDSRWGGKWEVDHCNGRHSAITEYLAESSKEVIQAWVNEAVQEVLTTELKSKIMKDAKAALKKEIDTQVKQKLNGWELGKKANPIIEELLLVAANEVREELGLKKKGALDE